MTRAELMVFARGIASQVEGTVYENEDVLDEAGLPRIEVMVSSFEGVEFALILEVL